MICCWAENPNSDSFKKHLPRIYDMLWLAEDGMKAQVLSCLLCVVIYHSSFLLLTKAYNLKSFDGKYCLNDLLIVILPLSVLCSSFTTLHFSLLTMTYNCYWKALMANIAYSRWYVYCNFTTLHFHCWQWLITVTKNLWWQIL
jgi:hypothetical protein